MASRRSQFIVVSNDRHVIRTCQVAAKQTDAFRAVRRVGEPELLPGSLDLNDWLILDLDYADFAGQEWSTRLSALAAQVVATATDDPDGRFDLPNTIIRRFILKRHLDRQLKQLFAEDRDRNPLAGQTPPQIEAPLSQGDIEADASLALQVADFASAVATLDGSRVIEVGLERLSAWFQARLVSIYEFDDERRLLTLVGKTHPYPIDEQISLDQHDRALMVQAVQSRQILRTGNWPGEMPLPGEVVRPTGHAGYLTDSCIIAPLIAGQRRVGVLNLADPAEPVGFNTPLARLIDPICRLMGSALGNARTFRQVKRQARTDPLTGLLNRRSFAAQLEREVQRAKRYGSKLSLAMIDMDELKVVNDTYGHVVGDRVIREGAQRISNTIREIDTAARYGGDEFAVILPSTALPQAERVADRLAAAMANEPCRIHEVEVSVSFSVGLCEYDDGSSASQFVEAADAALYAAKSRGKNCVAAAAR